MKRIFFALLIIISSTGLVFAQDCENALIEADRLINSGNVEEVPAVLSSCIDKLSRQDKVEAYKKLTIAYLYMDDPFGAETSFLALLNEDPEFKVSESDPIELTYLSQQYITTPIVSWSARLGGNLSTIAVIHTNTANSEPSFDNTRYKPALGFNISGAFDLQFNKTVSLFIEAQLGMWQYKKEDSIFSSEPQFLSSQRLNYQGSLPVGIKFTYPGEVNFPYVYAGYQPSFTFRSNVNDKRDPETEAIQEVNGLDLTNQINQFNNSLIVGIGFKRRIGRRFGYKYILIDLRYRIGLTNVTNEKTTFDLNSNANRQHITKYLQVEDDFHWNSLELSVGFVLPQYKPRKKNSVTIQSTLSKWFSKKDKNE